MPPRLRRRHAVSAALCIANLKIPADREDFCQAANFVSSCPANCQRPSRGLVHRCVSVCIGGSNALLDVPSAIVSKALEPPMYTDGHRWTKPRDATVRG